MIRIAEPTFLHNEKSYVLDCLDNRQLSAGKYVRKFEDAFAKAHGAAFAVSCNSGTAALHLLMLALGVGEGDEVIMPATTYIATANAIRYCGGRPVFVDVDPNSWLMDPEQVAAAITSHTVGIIAVHLYGSVMRPLPCVNRIWTIEDSCEAHGVPLSSRAAAFSFYGNKILTCGEGGMVLTNDPDMRHALELYRNQGQGSERYIHQVIGYNYRMPELVAAVGYAQTQSMSFHTIRRRHLYGVYREHLPKHVEVQEATEQGAHWVMPIRVKNREEVVAYLNANGIETRPVFPPLHLQPCYADQAPADPLPVAEQLGREGLLLPLHLQMTEADVRQVCKVLGEATVGFQDFGTDTPAVLHGLEAACSEDSYADALNAGRFLSRRP